MDCHEHTRQQLAEAVRLDEVFVDLLVGVVADHLFQDSLKGSRILRLHLPALQLSERELPVGHLLVGPIEHDLPRSDGLGRDRVVLPHGLLALAGGLLGPPLTLPRLSLCSFGASVTWRKPCWSTLGREPSAL